MFRRVDYRPLFVFIGLSLISCTSDDDPATFDALYNDVFATSCVDGCHSATVGAGNLFLEGNRAYDSIVNGNCDDEDAQAAGMVQVVKEDLEILTFQVLFLTFLKIFLAILVEEVEEKVEEQILGALT